jgi:hypothetical protein
MNLDLHEHPSLPSLRRSHSDRSKSDEHERVEEYYDHVYPTESNRAIRRESRYVYRSVASKPIHLTKSGDVM